MRNKMGREPIPVRSQEELVQLGQRGGGLVYVSFGEFPDARSGDYLFRVKEGTNIFFRQYKDNGRAMLMLDSFSCPAEWFDFDPCGISVIGARVRGPQVLDGSQKTARELVEDLRREGMWVA